MDARIREVIDAADQLVDQERVRLDHLRPLDRLRLEAPADFANSAVQRRLEDLQRIGARARAPCAPPCLLVQLGDQRSAIDDGAAIMNAVHGNRDPSPCI